MKKVLFIDRDGVLMHEPANEQVDAIEKVVFPNGMFSRLAEIASKLDYELVMVTNQDGLGTESYPETDFWPYHELLLRSLRGEDVVFSEILIDRSFVADNSPYRKPNTGLLTKYLEGDYDLANSFVIGDRWSDMQLAANLGSQGIWIHPRETDKEGEWRNAIAFKARSWAEVHKYLFTIDRKARALRSTSETATDARINLDGAGTAEISTGLHFLDHMLDQIAKHGSFGKKAGITRYGYALPMDDCEAQVLLDFGGRPWIEWDVDFKREKIGDVPTEMFYHFFKSFSDHTLCNLNIKASGTNEHHKIEAIFKAFARAIKMAKARDTNDTSIPSTKGSI